MTDLELLQSIDQLGKFSKATFKDTIAHETAPIILLQYCLTYISAYTGLSTELHEEAQAIVYELLDVIERHLGA